LGAQRGSEKTIHGAKGLRPEGKTITKIGPTAHNARGPERQRTLELPGTEARAPCTWYPRAQ